MESSSRIWMAVAVVAMVIAVCLGGYIILSDDDEAGEYDWHLGIYDIYDVTGEDATYFFEGTLKSENVKVEGDMMTSRETWNIYKTLKGVEGAEREPYMVYVVMKTYDISVYSLGDDPKQANITTKFGDVAVDVYLDVNKDVSEKWYVDPNNILLVYLMESVSSDGSTLTFTLAESTYL